jgi:ComF family protein
MKHPCIFYIQKAVARHLSLATLKDLINNFIRLFYPALCVICKEPLIGKEHFFCLECFLNLPKTNYQSNVENQAFDRFLGKIPLERASSFLYYNKGGIGQTLIEEIKYKGNRNLGVWIGAYMANELISSEFFEGVDYLLPVPLHSSKEKKRGFNQSERIAEGIAKVTQIQMDTKNVFRRKANTSQTKKGRFERWQNTQGLFDMKDPELFAGKHVLIIDDVLTTGSTLESVAQSILKSQGARVSILTLGIT